MSVLTRVAAPPRSTKLLALGATLATVLVAVTPGVHFTYRAAPAHAALETTAALIGLLAAYLLLLRFRLGRIGPDLWLAVALAILSTATLLFAVVPALAAVPPGPMLVWARVFTDAVGFAIFAAAAWLPLRSVSRPAQAERVALVVVGATLLLAFLVALVSTGALPRPIDPLLSPESSMRPQIAGAVWVEVAQALAALALEAAAIGFARRFYTDGDDFFRWLSTAAWFGVLARVNYFLFPSLYSQWVHTGDFLRLAYHLLILTASVREIAAYQPRLAHAAVLDERRRIARDLHDGLAQELAYIASGLRSFSDDPPTEAEVERLVAASDQALTESRYAISALTSDPDEPLATAVARVASALVLRSRAALDLQLEDEVEARPAVRDAVLRITREAITNAVRHGAPNEVTVTLSGQDQIRLAVADDGGGFAPGRGSARDALGLVSMRERTESLGGELTIESAPGSGTRILAVLPR